MTIALPKKTHANNLIDVDGLLMKRLDTLPLYDAVKDSDYCKLHTSSLDVIRALGLARILLWFASSTSFRRSRSDG